MTPSSGSINLLEQLIEFREMLTFTSLLKDIIKIKDEQIEEEVQMIWEDPKHRSLSLHGVGMGHLLEWMCSPTWKLTEPPTVGILFNTTYRHDQSLTPFPDPLPSLENRRWD